jgi:hypothetical protein
VAAPAALAAALGDKDTGDRCAGGAALESATGAVEMLMFGGAGGLEPSAVEMELDMLITFVMATDEKHTGLAGLDERKKPEEIKKESYNDEKGAVKHTSERAEKQEKKTEKEVMHSCKEKTEGLR